MTVNLSIKGVPEPLAERLRARAERHHRSLQGELMAIIERAAAEETVGDGPRGFVRGTKTIEQIAAEHRVLYPEPLTGYPLAVDIIRKDRDTR